jgi:hypothetical protein
VPVYFYGRQLIIHKSPNDNRNRTFSQICQVIFLFFFSVTDLFCGYAALLMSSSVAHCNFTLLTEFTYYLLAVGGSSLTI